MRANKCPHWTGNIIIYLAISSPKFPVITMTDSSEGMVSLHAQTANDRYIHNSTPPTHHSHIDCTGGPKRFITT